jgi:signal recognition particle GTPase
MKKLALILAIFFYFATAWSQSSLKSGLTDEEINELSSNLAMKLLLNESQTNSVTELLKTYRSDLSKVMGSSVAESQNKVMKSTNEQIVALLDSKQKMKYNVVSTDWWKSVQEAVKN